MTFSPLRLFVAVACMFIPWGVKRWLMVRALGYKLAKDSRIGMSLVLCEGVELDSKASIGHFTVIRNLRRLCLEEGASIGQFNWISGYVGKGSSASFAQEKDRLAALFLGKGSAVTHRHTIDCTNTVSIGAFSTVAGYRSQIITHGINIDEARQESSPVHIGSYCIVSTGCLLLKGAVLPDRCVLAAGAVLTKQQTETDALYAGVPARKVKSLARDAKYFTRETGYVV
jgi:carbonic anhydrase/acetyltransferase-like protein (isoleucine patch superfamily)